MLSLSTLPLLFILACGGPGVVDEDLFFQTEGADLRVSVEGTLSSDPSTPDTFILLLHGGPGGSGHEYNTGVSMDLLEEELVMVYWDQRGQGGSQGNYSPEEVTIQQLAEDTEALARFIRARYGEDIQLYLMGHSWGGTLGTAALLDTDIEEVVDGWIEADGAHDIPMLNQAALDMFVDIGGREIAAGRSKRDWKPIVKFAEGVDRANVTLDDGDLINEYGFEAEWLLDEVAWGDMSIDLAHGIFTPVPWAAGAWSGGETAWLIYDEVEAASYTDRLGEITTPTLLLWGRYDFVVPPALGESALEALGSDRVELVMFERSGHSPMVNQPLAFAEAILDFIRGAP